MTTTADRMLGSVLLVVLAGVAWFLSLWGLLGGGTDAFVCQGADCVPDRLTYVVRFGAAWPPAVALATAVWFGVRWVRRDRVWWVPVAGVLGALAGWLPAVLAVASVTR